MIELHPQIKWETGTSYITIPEGIERGQYVFECFMTGLVSITSEAGGIINKVPITKSTLQEIHFPDEGELFGSQVVYVLDQIHNKQIVVGVLPGENENADNQENEFVIKRKFNDAVCELRLNPIQETISLTVTGDSPNIYVSNPKGTIEIVGDKKDETFNTSFEKIETLKQLLVGNKNKFTRIVQSDTEVLVESDKFVLTKEEEPFAQGNVLKDFLDKFIQTVADATVATSIGTQPLINKIQILQLKEETKNILSKYYFMKKNDAGKG